MNEEEYPVPEILVGLEIVSVHIKNNHEFGFIYSKNENIGVFETNETFLVFLDLRKPEDERWTIHNIGPSMGVHGGFVALPQPSWIFGYSDDAEIIVVLDDGSFEKEQIPPRAKHLSSRFNGLFFPENGSAYALSRSRKITKREADGKWVKFEDGIPHYDYLGADRKLYYRHGFSALDGFSDSDLYAAGGEGDLWHCDGQQWRQIDLPTNADLEEICCAGDGQVYITTGMDTILKGRGERWDIIIQEEVQYFGKMVWYQDRIYISKNGMLFEIWEGVFRQAGIAKDSPYTFGHMAARDNMLLCGDSSGELSYYDGSEWHKLIYRNRDPEAGKRLIAAMKEWEKKHGSNK